MTAEGLALGEDGLPRCWWSVGDPMNQAYHDREWGRPVADDRRLFETLCLEGFQSGLSWLTILRKRENFRAAFAGFVPAVIARFGDDDLARLMTDTGIVRHRAKILATITNARRYPDLVAEFGSLAAYIWRYEPQTDQHPAQTTNAEARAMSADLRRRGWAFVGPTTAYSMMEEVGLVNNHVEGCHVRAEVERDRAVFARPGAANRPNRA